MNICIVSTSTPLHRQGGTELQADSLARLAAARGHRVFWVTTAHPEGIETEERPGIRIYYLKGTSYRMSRAEAPAWWTASAAKLSRLCEEERIDAVWAENFAGLSYAAIPRAERKPVISIVNGLAVRGEIASNFNRVSSARELFYLFYYIPRFRAMVRDSDLLVGVSRETTAALEREFPASAAKFRTIFNPVDTALFRPDAELRKAARAEFGFTGENKVLLMAGILHKQKGLHVGLEAFSRLRQASPSARLLIVGDGPELPALKAAAAEPGLSGAVSFAGARRNGEMPFIYNGADIYLNPTMRMEGLGLVTVEAMACGLPSVVSKIGGTASTITDGISGFFVPPGDAEALAAKAALLLNDSPLAAAMGAAARARAVSEFSGSNIDRYLELSRELARIKE
jgi:glycosyltransferase involved in cell wall biosynthesis